MGHSYISNGIANVSAATGLGTEQISFVSCIMMSYIAAFVFRYKLNPKTTSADTRLLFSGCFGIWLLFFSWGGKMIIPLSDAIANFLVLKYANPKYAHKITFVLSMGFLSVCHLNHLYNFHKSGHRYSTDFTGPNMILTQRIISVAFNVHDGTQGVNAENLTEDQKKHAIRKFPTFLEYFSYVFMFMGVVAGPFVFFEDYMEFIEGRNYKSKQTDKSSEDADPPFFVTAVRKFFVGSVMAGIFVYGGKTFPYLRNVDEEFIRTTDWFQRLIFMYISLLICRSKYYIAWSFADGVCNVSGLGFNGYDEKGRPKWNLVSNINIAAIETSTSAKVYIDNWNIMTGQWLRSVCYDRAPRKYRMVLTFLLSAAWHGFFPGYYMTFLFGHVVTLAQRKVRRNIRPMFQSSSVLKGIYEVITWFATHLAISYIVIPFVILEFEGSFRFYRACYFCGHLICFALILALPRSQEHSQKKVEISSSVTNGHVHSEKESYTAPKRILHANSNGSSNLVTWDRPKQR